MTNQELIELDKREDETRANILKDYSNNILIEALAGAGKTTILVERLLHQVVDLQMDPAEIVAITFTEKAADELKARYQVALLKRYQQATEKEKESIQNAVNHIDDIQISTIHSFCSKLLREMAFEAQIGMDFELVVNKEEEKFKKAFFERFVRVKSKEDVRKKLYELNINVEQLFPIFCKMLYQHEVVEWEYKENLVTGPSPIPGLYQKINQDKVLTTIMTAFTSNKQDAKTKKTIPGFTEEEIYHCGRVMVGTVPQGDPTIDELAKSIYEYGKKNNAQVVNYEGIKLLTDMKFSVSEKTGKTTTSKFIVVKDSDKKDYDPDCLEKSKGVASALAPALEDIRILLEGIKKEIESYSHALCMSILVEARKEYLENVCSGGTFSNDDLLLITRKLIHESDLARDYFRSRYKYFYIDEYQDTDPIQTDILKYLTAQPECINLPLEQVEFMDNRFCLIGDPKQSIYGFRGADVRLYGRMCNVMKAESRKNCIVYYMNRNYRSSKEVCDFVVDKFISSLNDPFGFKTSVDALPQETQATFDVMLSPQPAGDTVNYVKGVYKYVVQGTKEKYGKCNYSEKDMEHVACMIENMIHNKAQIASYDARQKKYTARPVCYGDFMLISRKITNENLSLYASYLKQKGIPVLVSGDSSIDGRESAPVKGIARLAILSSLLGETTRKNRDYKLLLVLVKIFGIKIAPTDLFEYGKILFGPDAKNQIITINDSCIKQALMYLFEILQLSRKFPLEALERLATNYSLLLRENLDEQEITAEVGALEQLMEKMRGLKYGSYQELDEQLQATILDRKSNKKGMPLGEEESKNAVRIMNMHQSKGLEANIVILIGPGSNAPSFKDEIVVGDDGTACVDIKISYKRKPGEYSPSRAIGKSESFDEYAGAKKVLFAEEELRILYVAATRAKECLIICQGDMSKNCWSNLADIIPAIDPDDPATPDYQKMIMQGKKYGAVAATATNSNTSNTIVKNMIAETQKFEVKEQKIAEKIEAAKVSMVKEIQPSMQEVHTGKGHIIEGYMHGNMYGTMMHKFAELLVGAYWDMAKEQGKTAIFDKKLHSTEAEMRSMLRQTAKEGLNCEDLTPVQCERLMLDPEVVNIIDIDQAELLANHIALDLQSFAEKLVADEEFQKDLLAAERLYTEMPFKLYLDEAGKQSVKEVLKETVTDTQQIRLNGTMDLVLELEDKFIIWDYKSDVIKQKETQEAFHKRLYKDYMPQLTIYREALKAIVASNPQKAQKPIETKLFHRFR